MAWNWQSKNWPQFVFNNDDFAEYERHFFEKAGIMYGSLQHIDEDSQEALKIDLMSDEALKTSAIEGELLNRDSIQSSIRRQFGLQTDHRKIPPGEQGIAEMTVDQYKTWQAPLDEKKLCSWHRMLTDALLRKQTQAQYLNI